VGAALDALLTWRAWKAAAPELERVLPAAFALGVPARVLLRIVAQGRRRWRIRLHDHADPTLRVSGMPAVLALAGGAGVELACLATPTRRGELQFAPADLRVRSRWRLLDLCTRLGAADTRRCYPDFAQVARYAWLAGDRRLAEMGIKTY